ncbi:hypothetical protein CHH28_06600 [Bacterioplanes sanyensis]|uniref:Uncharacterized protein n=1 Tax=Bacterioplanes sanyensis TaxID=1249553 RepID=A0A222FHA3_9GAMM|nr:hypothetical protein [Bacterioplanes sanyensis]ASP38368.1 hypothetical protein CHH28_06600 [Bacterioplanes sanyensis]
MSEESEQLTEEQRIARLERHVSTNRTTLAVLVLIGVVMLSVGLTVAVVKFLEPETPLIDHSEFVKLQKQVEALTDSADAYQQNLVDAKRVMDSSNATAFKRILLEQERSYQTHLRALKDGMRDLARMVPGSRTWLEIYNEQMDEALLQSRDRQKYLQSLQTDRLPQAQPLDLD